MRIMILVPGLPLNMNEIKGGVHSAVSNLLKGFAQHDVQVKVISFTREVKKGEDRSVAITPNIEIYYAYEGPYPYHSINYLLKGPGILKKHIDEFKPDIIHYEEGNSFIFTGRGILKKQKYLQTIHGMAYAEAKRKKTLKDKMTWYFNGWLQMAMMPENIIHLSQFSKNLLQEKHTRHSAIIPNAIIPQYFEITAKNKTANSLLYVGVIDNNKNLLFLLYSLKELLATGKIFTIDVLGGYIGDLYKTEVENYIKDNTLQEHVRFHGWVPQTTVIKFITNTDILVVSSKHESLPMVIAEAMAAGKVVAASAVGGIPEMIEHNSNGFLFNLAEANGLVNILSGLYNNDEAMKKIATKAKQTAIEKYQCQNVAKKTIEFYKSCINNNS